MRELFYIFVEFMADLFFYAVISFGYVVKKTFVENTVITFAIIGLIIVLSFYNSLPIFI